MSDFQEILLVAAKAAVSKSSVNAVARASGVDVAAVHRFVNGERSLSLGTASKLARHLGVEVSLPNGKRRKA